MAKKKEYGNDSIVSLKGADRVRKRPAVIFGSARVKVKVLTWSHYWPLPVIEGSWHLDRRPGWCLLNDLITNPQFGMNLKISGKRLFEECMDYTHTSTPRSPHDSPNQKGTGAGLGVQSENSPLRT